MATIREILNSSPSLADLIRCFEIVKDNGDVALIKFDGARTENWYTVLITFPPGGEREMIRADESCLEMALRKVLLAYIDYMH